MMCHSEQWMYSDQRRYTKTGAWSRYRVVSQHMSLYVSVTGQRHYCSLIDVPSNPTLRIHAVAMSEFSDACQKQVASRKSLDHDQ
jgi:hypothetical protein